MGFVERGCEIRMNGGWDYLVIHGWMICKDSSILDPENGGRGIPKGSTGMDDLHRFLHFRNPENEVPVPSRLRQPLEGRMHIPGLGNLPHVQPMPWMILDDIG